MDILEQFNWVDVFVVIILFRIGYISIKSGLAIELFKLLGVVLAIYLSLHYYTLLSDKIRVLGGAKKLPLEFIDFFIFLGLAILGYLILVLLRSLFYRLIRMEAVPQLDKWGSLVLGIARGVLLAGLIIFILVLSRIGYLKNSVDSSHSGKRIFKVAPATYSLLWNSLMSKFMPKEKFNNSILEVYSLK